MGKVIRNTRWTKPRDYKPAKRRGPGWFGIALVILPLAAFSAVLLLPASGNAPAEAEASVGFVSTLDTERAHFPLCSGPVRTTCVVDGDTIWYRGEKIRLVGFDTPEIGGADCARERMLGERAKLRLQDWLNEGAFRLEPNPEGRSRDRYGRSLMVVSRGGESVGQVMLAVGLAEKRGGKWNVWCQF